MKVLNLFSGIGGNRKLWEDVEVTAVEIDSKIAGIYQELFPKDTVVIGDAHQYLLDHFTEFDFIWSSPPCPTHSHLNHILHNQGVIRYPDMMLYQEIIFLQTFYKGLYCVENVRSYYDPLIKPFYRGRHYLWSNFFITEFKKDKPGFDTLNLGVDTKGMPFISGKETYRLLLEYLGFDSNLKVPIKLLQNCVYPPLGKHILNCANGNTQKTLETSINKQTKRMESV